MSYVNKVLQPGEVAVYETSIHWWVYARSVGMFVVTLILLIALPTPAKTVAAALTGAITVIFWLRAFISRSTIELAVTNRRIIYKSGLIRRNTVEMNLSKVESVDVSQGILGRMLDFGHVLLNGDGGGRTPAPLISAPLKFRSYVTAR